MAFDSGCALTYELMDVPLALLTLKEGVKAREGAGGRGFYLWEDGAAQGRF